MTTKKKESVERKSQSSKTKLTPTTQKETNTSTDPQEIFVDEDLEEKKLNLFDRAQEYMSDQSSKFSNVARSLMFGIIGTIWIISYTEAGLDFSNCWLFTALSLSLLYFLVDVIHYFWSAMSYLDVSNKTPQCMNPDQYDVQLRRMETISGRTVACFVIKFIVLIIAATAFCIGLYTKMV